MEICTTCLVGLCGEHAYMHYTKTAHQFSISVRSAEEVSLALMPFGTRITEYLCRINQRKWILKMSWRHSNALLGAGSAARKAKGMSPEYHKTILLQKR